MQIGRYKIYFKKHKKSLGQKYSINFHVWDKAIWQKMKKLKSLRNTKTKK
jgi:hypothetical protein